VSWPKGGGIAIWFPTRFLVFAKKIGIKASFAHRCNERGISRQYEDAKLSSLNLTLGIELSCKQPRSSTMYNRSMFKVVPDTRSTDPVVIVKYIWQAHPSNAHFGFFSRREYQLHRPLQILSLRVLRMSRKFAISHRGLCLANHIRGRGGCRSYAHLRVPLREVLPTLTSSTMRIQVIRRRGVLHCGQYSYDQVIFY
jgi:hypothetical protein